MYGEASGGRPPLPGASLASRDEYPLLPAGGLGGDSISPENPYGLLPDRLLLSGHDSRLLFLSELVNSRLI